ncbi:MAG: NAD-binding oxidoreductase, partial [Rikenellaceae bacterium]
MFKILKKKQLATNIYLMDVEAPRVAATALPGQFVIVKVDEKGERVPLTICDYNREKGSVTIVTQIVGSSSQKICDVDEGGFFQNFVGPLGRPSEFVYENIDDLKKKSVVFIAGGLGTAPVYPQVKWMKEQGVDCDVI